MAELVGVFGVTHNPLMWRVLRDGTPPDLAEAVANFELLRAEVARLEPDVIVLVASDHFHMLMMSNMPAFLIGKTPRMRAGHPNEKRVFALDTAWVPGDHDLAAHLLGEGLRAGFDFAFSDEPWLDHSFLVPLLFLTPDLDVPVVPVMTNCNAPPIPSAARFAELGEYLAGAVRSHPGSRRVLIVGSGHLALELGGPRQFLGESPDPDFDSKAVDWMAAGDLRAVVEACTVPRLAEAGNETFQFLNFVACLAAAGGVPARIAEGVPTRFANLPFFAWATT